MVWPQGFAFDYRGDMSLRVRNQLRSAVSRLADQELLLFEAFSGLEGLLSVPNIVHFDRETKRDLGLFRWILEIQAYLWEADLFGAGRWNKGPVLWRSRLWKESPFLQLLVESDRDLLDHVEENRWSTRHLVDKSTTSLYVSRCAYSLIYKENQDALHSIPHLPRSADPDSSWNTSFYSCQSFARSPL